MSEKLPDDFLSLADTESKLEQEVNVIGVVVDYLPPTQTRGTGMFVGSVLVELFINKSVPSRLATITRHSGSIISSQRPGKVWYSSKVLQARITASEGHWYWRYSSVETSQTYLFQRCAHTNVDLEHSSICVSREEYTR